MTIWEISEKADYIAQRHQQLQEQWHLYCNSLVQGITLSKARSSRDELRGAGRYALCPVRPFQVNVTLAEASTATPSSTTSRQKTVKTVYCEGAADGRWHGGRPRQQPRSPAGAGALSGKIAPVYNGLYAVEHDLRST
jgi:formate hydrogenlyase regulatory protein HycA